MTGKPDPGDRASILVVVVRSGGFAGLRREWRAEPDADEAPRWRDLISECPWDHTPGRPRGADRFVWTICARCGDDARSANLTDDEVSGPWRELIDEVRAWHAARR